MAKPAAVECRNVSCGYGDVAVMEDVDLRVERGEVVAILGRSGSGKSTLLRSMAGLLAPLTGGVELFGVDLYGVDSSERHRMMHRTGMLFQQDALFGSMTVLENVMLPLVELSDLPRVLAEDLARSKLALVKVAELGRRMPSEVSGGQRKRVALARAIVLDPDLLLCDEPTSGLDPLTASQLDETLLALRDSLGVAIVAVTHDVDTVRTIADRAIVLGDRGVRATGSIDELECSTDADVHFFFHRGQRPQADRVEGAS